MRVYKFLAAGAVGRFSGAGWPLPAAGAPGAWIEAAGPLEECLCGVHACRADDLLDWLDDELWEVEVDGAVLAGESALVAERGRLLRRVETWDATAARAFADACAARLDDIASAAACFDAVTAAELQGFAADCTRLRRGARPEEELDAVAPAAEGLAAAIAANVAFVSAHAAGRAAAATGDGDRYQAAFTAERAWQLRWLRARVE